MSNIVIGKHTLESLTSGMYSDPFVCSENIFKIALIQSMKLFVQELWNLVQKDYYPIRTD